MSRGQKYSRGCSRNSSWSRLNWCKSPKAKKKLYPTQEETDRKHRRRIEVLMDLLFLSNTFELKMSTRLPAMIFSNPIKEEVLELDFSGGGPAECVRPKGGRSKKDERGPISRWDALPDILLEDIFARLSIKERYHASQVCRNWNRLFYSRTVWKTFFLTDRTLTRRKFNYYMGDQYVLDHHRMQLCLHRVARGFRHLVIRPMENFFNLYEFMTILSYFGENFEPLVRIRTLDFTFGCDFSAENVHGSDKVFGTGGKLLEALKRMMDDLKGLRHLALQDLLLEKEEAKYLLDDVVYNCCETLHTLKLVNCCKEPFSLLHPAVFVNLRTLTLSPQHLGDDNLLLLASNRLRDLYLLQTRHTHKRSMPVQTKMWRDCRKIAPFLRVHHVLERGVEMPIVWQEGAAVRSIVCHTPEAKVCAASIFTATNLYSNTLEVVAYPGFPDYKLADHFEDRADAALILLSKCCLFLDTLVVRDRISTATILLLATQSKNLRRLVVRKNALLMKCDWPHNPEWSDSYYNWLRITSGSCEKVVEEVSKLLECKWHPLSDEEFMSFNL